MTDATSALVATIQAKLEETVFAIKTRVQHTPTVGLVLGSGLGGFADTLLDLVKVPYPEIPNFASSAVVGHAGNLCFGTVDGVSVVCMQGRVHSYEGHPAWQVVHGVRTMARLGVGAVLITNAAGGVDTAFAPGDLMLIEDHLNLTGQTPLLGLNEDALGPRFPDMTAAYDPGLQQAAIAVAEQNQIKLQRGVYAGLLGPSYETPAEVRMVRSLGGHAVGMSTVLETLALRHMGVRVGALSCITNAAAGISGEKLDHKEVEEVAREARGRLTVLLCGWIAKAAEKS